jgi:methylenetetrahydrofolate dehydrogenase (NADP+) / methenyltetrahydrofolate cyclohydrolase
MILNGKKLAHQVKTVLKDFQYSAIPYVKPKLAIIQVGNDPASSVYVGHKIKAIQALDWLCETFFLPPDLSQENLVQCIHQCNRDANIHGLIIQLPLPDSLEPFRDQVLALVMDHKDVDGLHPTNQGLLFQKDPDAGFTPCTPLGCLMLLRHYGIALAGSSALIVGRSNLVGKPLGLLLLRENSTVTFAHSHTKNLQALMKNSQIIAVATGNTSSILPRWLPTGSILLDIGIHQSCPKILSRTNLLDDTDFPHPNAPYRTSLHGDVLLDQETKERLASYTPVPGGVGPMTVTALMYNTLKAACLAQGTTPLGLEELLCRLCPFPL